MGAIIDSGKATLRELTEYYTLEEAMIIWEAIAIPRYNEYLAAKYQRSKAIK